MIIHLSVSSNFLQEPQAAGGIRDAPTQGPFRGRYDALLPAEPGQHAGDLQVSRSHTEKRSEFCLLEELAVLSLDMPKCFVR